MIDSTAADRGMVVIVHGDHGSRIPLHDPDTANVAVMQPADLSDAFSTLFAIRAPAIAPGYDRRFAPINELVGRFSGSHFTQLDVPQHESRAVRIGTGFGRPFMTLHVLDTALVLVAPEAQSLPAPGSATSPHERPAAPAPRN
jgi:hypothetical protein